MALADILVAVVSIALVAALASVGARASARFGAPAWFPTAIRIAGAIMAVMIVVNLIKAAG